MRTLDLTCEVILDLLACYTRPIPSYRLEKLLRRQEVPVNERQIRSLLERQSGVEIKRGPFQTDFFLLSREQSISRLRGLDRPRHQRLLKVLTTQTWDRDFNDIHATAWMAAWTGEIELFRQSTAALPSDMVTESFCQPFDPDLHASLHEEIRSLIEAFLFSRSLHRLEPTPRFSPVTPQRFNELGTRCDWLLLREGPAAVSDFLRQCKLAAPHQHAWNDLFERPDQGAEIMDGALKSFRRLVGGRPFFFDLSGPLLALALLRANQLDKLRKLSYKDSRYPNAMSFLQWPARASEQAAHAEMEARIPQGLPGGPSLLFASLALFWVFPEHFEDYRISISEESRRVRDSGFTWMADQLDQLLLRSEGRSGPPSLVDWVSCQAPWQRSLEALARLNEGGPTRERQKGATRLFWEYTPVVQKLVAREQRELGSGEWSAGKVLSLKKLRDSAPAYLIEQDHRILKHLQPGERLGSLELGERAWLELVGHPHASCEVVRGDCELKAARQADVWLLELHPTFHRGQSVALDDSQPLRLVVYERTPALERVASVVGQGLQVPESGIDQLRATLESISSLIKVRGWKGLGARRVPSDETLRLLARPSGQGLKLELRVRPLGQGGAAFAPGEGPSELAGQVEGKLLETVRNLSREKQRAAKVHITRAEETGDFSWRTYLLEDTLELLEEVSGSELVLEWPEGAALKLRRPQKGPSLRVASGQDWFSVEGELELDQEKLELARLLELVRSSQGRFVPLAPGEYLALTDELRRKLDDLATVAEGKKGRVHPLAAGALEDLPGDQNWEKHKERMARARALEPRLPRTLEAELRPYQEHGVRWMLRLASLGAGACLADDMGLGKTLQALAVMLSRAAGGPALVVAPTSVCPNWIDEARRFAPTLNLRQLPARDRGEFLKTLGSHDVLVASYGLLEELSGRRWHTVVLDEAQAIKNASTQRSKAARELVSDYRIITTGTPVENHLGELWSLFSFLNPGLLGSQQSFNQRFGSDEPSTRRRLKRLVGPFLLRRTKSQVLSELPPRTDITLHVELPPDELALYESLREQAMRELNESSDPIAVLAQLTRLRRACCHPELVASGCGLPGAKLQAFLELVEELRENRHRALVFSQFVDVLQIARSALEQRGVSYQYLDGSTPMGERKKRVDAFQEGEGEVFLISLKAGGFGLNLTGADYVLHLDPWWNPAVEDQASDRAHRIGQERPVTVYRLVARGTVEEKIVALHGQKRELAESLLEDGHRAASLSTAELVRLLSE